MVIFFFYLESVKYCESAEHDLTIPTCANSAETGDCPHKFASLLFLYFCKFPLIWAITFKLPGTD